MYSSPLVCLNSCVVMYGAVFKLLTFTSAFLQFRKKGIPETFKKKQKQIKCYIYADMCVRNAFNIRIKGVSTIVKLM